MVMSWECVHQTVCHHCYCMLGQKIPRLQTTKEHVSHGRGVQGLKKQEDSLERLFNFTMFRDNTRW